jgi:hypothetical protein
MPGPDAVDADGADFSSEIDWMRQARVFCALAAVCGNLFRIVVFYCSNSVNNDT